MVLVAAQHHIARILRAKPTSQAMPRIPPWQPISSPSMSSLFLPGGINACLAYFMLHAGLPLKVQGCYGAPSRSPPFRTLTVIPTLPFSISTRPEAFARAQLSSCVLRPSVHRIFVDIGFALLCFRAFLYPDTDAFALYSAAWAPAQLASFFSCLAIETDPCSAAML